jgi:hypothetical protein
MHQGQYWTDEEFAPIYLQWLRRQVPGGILLLWDLFAAHRSLVVTQEAQTLRICLEFMPAGMTGQVQPFDRRIMGSLKQRAWQRFDNENIRNGDAACTIEDRVEGCLNVGKDITRDEAKSRSYNSSRTGTQR